MKKRILAILLTVCLVLSMATTAFAAEGVTVTDEAELIAALNDGGDIILGGDITLAVSLSVSKDTTIDLNGNSIIGADNSTGSFGLINIQPGVKLTIDDSKGDGKITLTATNDRGWNAYSSVISNQRGKLTVLGGTIENLGGTSMAYAIDNLTNGKGTYAETVIEGGTIKSTYRAIRQFLNGTEAQNILTVNGGTIEGGNKAIWMQDSNVYANPGTLTVGKDATIKGNVFLSVTKNSTEWPVSISIAEDVFEEGYTVEGNSNIPEDCEIKAIGGYWGIADVGTTEPSVAAVKGVCYPTLQAAIDAANAGDKITVLGNVEVADSLVVAADDEITIDLNGFTVSMVRTGTLSAYDQLIENFGDLTIEDSSEDETGALTYQYTGSTVSTGFAANTITNKPGATLTVNGGTIENKTTTGHTTYAIDSITNGNVGGKDTTVNVKGGTIKSVKGEGRGVALRACLNSTMYKNVVNITNGTIIGGYSGLQLHGISNQANNAELTIEDGNIEGIYSMYSYFMGADSSNVDITIKDGEFSGYVYLYNPQNGSSEKPFDVEISGGTFDSGVYTYTKDADGNEVSIKSITGGTFAEAPDADYIAEGYVVESYVNKDGETVYGVEPEVTVTFNAGVGTGTMDEVVIPAGEYTLPECGFAAPENYTFKAWKIGDTEYKAGDVVEIEEDTTVTAVYTINKYTVIFKADDDVVGTIEVEHGKDVTLPEVPAKDGYTGEWDNDGKNITADTVIKAVYTEVPVAAPDGSDSDTEDSDTETEDTESDTEDTGSGTTGTGDSSNIIFWIMLMIAAVAAGVIVVAIRKRNAGSEN